MKNYRSEPPKHGVGFVVITMLVWLGIAGCDGLLEVKNPGVIGADAWDDPANAELIVNAAIGDFECMLPSYIRSTGLIAHEIISSGVTGVDQNWGARRPILGEDTGACGGGVGFYNPLQDARFMADEGYRIISTFDASQVAAREAMLAALAAYGGYSYTLMGEGMCESAIDGGPLVTPHELLVIAEERFTTAATHAQAAGDNSLLNMARVGRARVRLNLGNTAGALQDASAVPEGFVRNATYSEASTRRRNTLSTTMFESNVFSVHPAYHNLDVDGVPDPRVELLDHGHLGVDNITPQWSPQKYSSRSSVIPIARWEEAQLIIAEIEGGQVAVDIINLLRDNAGLPRFSSSNESEIMEQVREERRRELFLESHRLNDMLRWGLEFPTGSTHKGQPYGTATCVPLPNAERDSNPNI